MAKFRMLNTKLWDDRYVIELDPIEKLLFIYLLTNALTSICGIYEIQFRRIAFDTGIDSGMIQKILERFESDHKIVYRDGWICIANFIKHQKINKSVEKGMLSAINDLPKSTLDTMYQAVPTLRQDVHNLNLNLNLNLNSNLNSKAAPKGVEVLSEPETITELQVKFPKVDVRSEIEKAKDWLEANGKHKKNYVAFARNWMRTAEKDLLNKPTGMVYCPKCGKRIMAAHQVTHRCEDTVSSFAKSLSKSMPSV